MDQKYKRMLRVMLEKEKSPIKRKTRGNRSLKESWFLYILRCNDGSLYTGIAKELERRFKMHNDGKASRYTRIRRPVKLVYHEVCSSRAQALVRECEIKEFSKKKKESLVEGDNSNHD